MILKDLLFFQAIKDFCSWYCGNLRIWFVLIPPSFFVWFVMVVTKAMPLINVLDYNVQIYRLLISVSVFFSTTFVMVWIIWILINKSINMIWMQSVIFWSNNYKLSRWLILVVLLCLILRPGMIALTKFILFWKFLNTESRLAQSVCQTGQLSDQYNRQVGSCHQMGKLPIQIAH